MSDPSGAPVVALEDGWEIIKTKALDVLERIIESGVRESKSNFFNPTEYVTTYTMCYDMCTQREPHSWSIQLYERHGESLRNYLSNNALEAINAQPDNPPQLLLQEYVKRWENHKIMNKWYQRFFMYLDRYHIVHYSLPPLLDSGWTIFKEVVYKPTKVGPCDYASCCVPCVLFMAVVRQSADS
jgi:cullin 1